MKVSMLAILSSSAPIAPALGSTNMIAASSSSSSEPNGAVISPRRRDHRPADDAAVPSSRYHLRHNGGNNDRTPGTISSSSPYDGRICDPAAMGACGPLLGCVTDRTSVLGGRCRPPRAVTGSVARGRGLVDVPDADAVGPDDIIPPPSSPCLTEEDCHRRSAEMGFAYFRVGEYRTMGCFSKGSENAFWSTTGGGGGTVGEIMTEVDLPGVRERIWCDDPTSSSEEEEEALEGEVEFVVVAEIESSESAAEETEEASSPSIASAPPAVEQFLCAGSVSELATSCGTARDCTNAPCPTGSFCFWYACATTTNAATTATPSSSPTKTTTLPPTTSPTKTTLPPIMSPTKSTLPPTSSPSKSTFPPTASPTKSTPPPTTSPTTKPIADIVDTIATSQTEEGGAVQTTTTAATTTSSTTTINNNNNNTIACLTSEQCEARFVELDTLTAFYDGMSTYSTKGCFGKGNNAFFSLGTVEEMSEADLPGVRERIWCDDGGPPPPTASSPTGLASPADVAGVADVDGAETANVTDEALGSDGALGAGEEGMGSVPVSDPVLGGGAQQQQERPSQSPTKYPTEAPAATKSSPGEEPMNNPTDASSPAMEQPPTIQPTKNSTNTPGSQGGATAAREGDAAAIDSSMASRKFSHFGPASAMVIATGYMLIV